MRWFVIFTALAALSLTVWSSQRESIGAAQAGTAVRMDLEQMVDAADRIVEARITGRRMVPDSRGRIVTEYRMDVRRTFLGSDSDSSVIRIPGGVLANGRAMVLPGMPRISVGEEVMLFLNGTETCMPTGMAQGKYRIMTDRAGQLRAVSNSGAVELVSASGANGEHSCESHGGVHSMLYSELSARVQARVADRRSREAFGQPLDSNR